MRISHTVPYSSKGITLPVYKVTSEMLEGTAEMAQLDKHKCPPRTSLSTKSSYFQLTMVILQVVYAHSIRSYVDMCLCLLVRLTHIINLVMQRIFSGSTFTCEYSAIRGIVHSY